MTPIGSRACVLMGRITLASARATALLLAEPLQRGGDADHLARVERLGERVGDPVDGALRSATRPSAAGCRRSAARACARRPCGSRTGRRGSAGRARSCPGRRSTRRRRPWRRPAGRRGASCPSRPRGGRSAARCRRSASRGSAASGSRTGTSARRAPTIAWFSPSRLGDLEARARRRRGCACFLRAARTCGRPRRRASVVRGFFEAWAFRNSSRGRVELVLRRGQVDRVVGERRRGSGPRASASGRRRARA